MLRFCNSGEASEIVQDTDLADWYFSPRYALLESKEWECALFGNVVGSMFVPIIMQPFTICRSTTDSTFDICSVYGYSGVCFLQLVVENKDALLTEFRKQFIARMKERGCISEFLRFHPFIDTCAGTLPHVDQFVNATNTVVLDVDRNYEEYFLSCCNAKNRTTTKAAFKKGFVADELRLATVDDVSPGSDFDRLYRNTMDRVHASDRYYFSYETLRNLVQTFTVYLSVVRNNATREVLSVGMFVVWNATVHFHLSGSLKQSGIVGVNNVMLHSAIKWACAQQHLKLFHFGGGISHSPTDGLLAFKQSFGGTNAPWILGKTIVNQQLYSEKLLQRSQALGVSENELEDTGFFPAYKASVT